MGAGTECRGWEPGLEAQSGGQGRLQERGLGQRPMQTPACRHPCSVRGMRAGQT